MFVCHLGPVVSLGTVKLTKVLYLQYVARRMLSLSRDGCVFVFEKVIDLSQIKQNASPIIWFTLRKDGGGVLSVR